jgi:DNA-binding transcriptional MerR regulator
MSGRSYLSIGDVLTLLRQEFEDITISKIRFLESQGLVNPERTPSGYRKFYEHDVERLRWVLRQQREHFLPLKVIKDRLDDGSADVEADDANGAAASSAPAAPAKATTRHRAGAGAHDDVAHAGDPVLVGQRVGAESATAASVGAHPVAEGAALPGIGGAPGRGAGPTGVSSGVTRAPARSGASSSRHEPARTPLLELVNEGTAGGSRAAVDPPGATAENGSAAASEASATDPTTSELSPSASDPPVPPAPASAAEEVGAEPEAPEGEKPIRPKPADRTTAGGTGSAGSTSSSPTSVDAAQPVSSAVASGVSLSSEELAAAAGIDLSVVGELQEYGLLVPSVLGGVEYFDEEALAVATVAAGFTRFGIEPRHLRIYRNAAEREAGFVEQVVLPLVRQRNPEARARAHETADELSRLGQQLRASLLRSALADLLNG